MVGGPKRRPRQVDCDRIWPDMSAQTSWVVNAAPQASEVSLSYDGPLARPDPGSCFLDLVLMLALGQTISRFRFLQLRQSICLIDRIKRWKK